MIFHFIYSELSRNSSCLFIIVVINVKKVSSFFNNLYLIFILFFTYLNFLSKIFFYSFFLNYCLFVLIIGTIFFLLSFQFSIFSISRTTVCDQSRNDDEETREIHLCVLVQKNHVTSGASGEKAIFVVKTICTYAIRGSDNSTILSLLTLKMRFSFRYVFPRVISFSAIATICAHNYFPRHLINTSLAYRKSLLKIIETDERKNLLKRMINCCNKFFQ